MDNLAYNKYPFLKELGIEPENFGAYYDGKWQGNGEVLQSINPSTEEIISTTKCASKEDYDNALNSMAKARAEWAAVFLFLLRCLCQPEAKLSDRLVKPSERRKTHWADCYPLRWARLSLKAWVRSKR